jgi:glutathione synthase/RimK-type ligase-like ATP-grasp enzyme
MVNNFDAYSLHFRKPHALKIASASGHLIPQSIISNDLDEIRDFVRQVGACIYKPVRGGAHAYRVTDDLLEEDRRGMLRLSPVTIQQEIEGTNIRVFVIGDKAMAVEIVANSLDFRDDSNQKIVLHKASDEFLQSCIRLARNLKLKWTGIDFRMTADRQYFFLEANFSPMFLGFQKATGLPIDDELCRYLISF